MKFTIFYIILAIILAIIGFVTQKTYWFVGAIAVTLCSFYWIRKEWKNSK